MKEVQYVGAHAIRMDEVALRWVVLCGVALLLLMASDVALADEASTAAKDALATSALGTALKNLVATLNGTIARSLAIIAVIGTGIAALTGRMEWSKAVVVVLGVGVIFSATALINGLFPPAA